MSTQESPRPATPLQRLTDFARRIIAVPKAEIDEQMKRYRRQRKRRKRA